MSNPNGSAANKIDKRDFDSNRPLLADEEVEDGRVHRRSLSGPRVARIPADEADDDGHSDGLLSDVVEGIVERDRRKLKKEIVRFFSFVWGVISWLV